MRKGPKKKSLTARAQKQIRTQKLMGGDETTIPADISRSKSLTKRYKHTASKIIDTKARKRQRFETRPTADGIGLGIFARTSILPGVKLEEISSLFGTRVSAQHALRARSAVQTEHPTGERYYLLLGTLAFANHACAVHANCIACQPREIDRKGVNDWKFLQTNEYIQKGEELTVCYSSECGLKCRQCK